MLTRPGATRPPCPSLMPLAASAILACAPARFAHAQDTRQVREPVIPAACAVLHASPAEAGQDDTKRIQSALKACPPGRALHLAPKDGATGFVTGPLTLPDGVTLVIDRGATLYASTNAALFDRGAGTCGTNDQSGKGCNPLITVKGGDGGGIMGDGVIDGQGGHTIDGKTESWWQIARRAQKENSRQNVPRLIVVDRARDFTLYRITLRNSPNFHVSTNGVDGFTAWGVRIDTPSDARNTDGIDPGASRNITIAHSYIRTGDDNVAIKAGSGMTENVSIIHNHFYSGHGMSIGSETNGGVRNVLVEDLDMDGTTSGLRIKSNDRRGGEVRGVVYRNVCLRDVKWPLYIDTHYEPGAAGQLIPNFADVRMEQVHSVTTGRVALGGYDDAHPLRLTLRNVVIKGKPQVKTEFALFDGQLNEPGAKAVDCSRRFVPFPGDDAQ